jgi:hypothetical protein
MGGRRGVRSIPALMMFRDGILLFAQPGMLPEQALEDLQAQPLSVQAMRRSLANPASSLRPVRRNGHRAVNFRSAKPACQQEAQDCPVNGRYVWVGGDRTRSGAAADEALIGPPCNGSDSNGENGSNRHDGWSLRTAKGFAVAVGIPHEPLRVSRIL